MSNIYVKSFAGIAAVVAGMAALVFLPAWTVDYWQAWVFLAVYGVAGAVIMAYLARRDPKLLERRMSGGPWAETRTSQRVIMSAASLGFVALLVLPALDHRFGWSSVPAYASIAADVLVVIGLWIVLRVFRENTYTASTIQVADEQRVISTGPYALVRHPMYSGSLLYIAAMPVALGSWWALLVLVPLLPVMVWRILDEEGFLANDLTGYAEYTRNVRYRLVPHVW
jgi:protein-S-isoprenylcysteine O-methyltransferase Ste14